MNTLVLNDKNLNVKNNSKTLIEGNKEETVKKDSTQTIGKNKTINIKENEIKTVDKEKIVTVKERYIEKYSIRTKGEKIFLRSGYERSLYSEAIGEELAVNTK